MSARTATDERTLTAANFPVLVSATTRWADNDMFGHLNNAAYYQIFDSAINAWLNEATGIDVADHAGIGGGRRVRVQVLSRAGFPGAGDRRSTGGPPGQKGSPVMNVGHPACGMGG
jgi:acyl-CoA thioester hydrolase